MSIVSHQGPIFVVDDQPSSLALLDQILRSQGYPPPVLISDPSTVITHYRRARPHLILLDSEMPGLSGLQVIEQLKALDDPLLPPIMVLAEPRQRSELVRALAAGAHDFLCKPIKAAELMLRVHTLLQSQHLRCAQHRQRCNLEALLQTRTEALKQTQLQVVRRLGRASEYRDNETGLHIIRMSKFAALLARELGWSDAACDLMLHASPMHDVGKIGIPDAILQKPGKLDAREWAIMKTHASIGADILDEPGSDLLGLARTIALSHHEKWDGSGYPQAQAGADIPEAGRIVAVADVFDALTSARPYKRAWPVDAAADYISANAGIHFDPAVVDAFERCKQQVLDIRGRYLEPPPSS